MIESPLLPFQFWTPDHIPRWLGPMFIYFGLLLVFGGALTHVFPEIRWGGLHDTDNSLSPQFRYFLMAFQYCLLAGFVFGAFFAVVGALRFHGYLWLYIAGIFALGSALQAAASLGFFLRVYVYLTEERWTGSPQKKLPKVLATLFVTFAAAYIAIRILTVGPFVTTVWRELQITWTVLTFSTATIGAAWKMRHLRGNYRDPILLGIVLLFAGIEIYNLEKYQTLATWMIAGLAGTLGFWLAGWLAIRSVRSQSQTDS